MKENKKEDRNHNLYDFDLENERKNDKVKKGKSSKERKDIQEEKKRSNHINSDNEIIIGVTRYPETKEQEKKQQKKMKKKTKDKNEKEKHQNKTNKNKQSKNNTTKKNVLKKEKNSAIKVLKWTSLFIIFIGIITFAMLSPIFNISEVIVVGNNEVASEKIISLSGITIGENIFRINKGRIKAEVKSNGYIEGLTIKRKLPDKVEISVNERQVNFIIEYGSGYAYINNQGYILEISNNKKAVPMILGIQTPSEQLVENNRLNDEDLEKLGVVLKIMSVAQVNDVASLITTIDITDDSDYKLYFDSEQKLAYLGTGSDLETRMLFIISILKSETGKPGEIFVNKNLNLKNAFFRESV